MIIYRITNSAYSNDLSGYGAKINGSRWNSKGIVMLYTAQHISLALLEMLVHTNFKDFSISLDLVDIQVPEIAAIKELSTSRLKKDWVDDVGYTRFIGDSFIQSNEALVLKVPSAVIQEEFNLLINPLHIDFKKIKISSVKSFTPDQRLFTL